MDRGHLVYFPRIKMGLWLLLSLLLTATLPASAQAGGTLAVRLVEAHNDRDGAADGLGDVAGVLRKNLQYRGFDLLGSGSIGLPADGQVGLPRGFRLECHGPQQALKVTVIRGGETLIDTTLNLRSGSPVVLGGFQSDRGRILLVLIVR